MEAAALKVKLQYIDKEAKQKAELDRVRTEMKLQIAQAKLDTLETARDSADENSQLAPEVDTNHKEQNFLKSQVVNNEPLLENAAGPSLTGSDVLFEGQTLTKEVKTSQSPLNPDAPQFLPHHGVSHPRKPGKLRVVFDGSARYMSLSLNELLLQGPDFINSLCGVLCRFRKEPVAFVCDIYDILSHNLVHLPPISLLQHGKKQIESSFQESDHTLPSPTL